MSKLELDSMIATAPPFPEGFQQEVQASSSEDCLRFHKYPFVEGVPPSPPVANKSPHINAAEGGESATGETARRLRPECTRSTRLHFTLP